MSEDELPLHGAVWADQPGRLSELLAGVGACQDKNTQTERFTLAGWDSAQCWNMNEVFSLLPQAEVSRVEAIERLDEKELLQNRIFQSFFL